jgi:hypothetical protein
MNATTVAPAQVVAILLADGWHRAVRGSFAVGTLGFGADADLGAPGFWCEEADHGSPYRPATLAGPLGSILAVRQVSSLSRNSAQLGCPAPRLWARPVSAAVA